MAAIKDEKNANVFRQERQRQHDRGECETFRWCAKHYFRISERSVRRACIGNMSRPRGSYVE